jgi:hypothetical protein
MYSLKVLKHLDHPDGRIFEPGHNCRSLSVFEVAELLDEYPDYFEAGDEATVELAKDKENVKHYAEAKKRQK